MDNIYNLQGLLDFLTVAASPHFNDRPGEDALLSNLADLAFLSKPFLLEFYLPGKHSASEGGLHRRIKTCLTAVGPDFTVNAEQKIPPLVIDIIARLSSFLRTLPPGLIQDERTIGDRLSQGREYLELIQVIGRAEARIIAGLEPFPKLFHSQKEEPIASSEHVDFGFHVKVKKAKDKGVKNGYKARSSVLDMERALQTADEDFLKRGGYPLLTDLTDISNLKACARRRLARVYIALLNTLRTVPVWNHICTQVRSHHNIPLPSTISANNAENKAEHAPPASSQVSRPSQPSSKPTLPAPRATLEATAEEPLPASFPSIQPLKAARLFECESPDLGSWQVYFSTRSISHFRQLDKSAMVIVVKKIKELSNGHFSSDNMKPLKGPADVPIYEAKCSRDLRIVYQIDLYNDAEQAVQRQILKIWGIVTHAEMDNSRLWSAVANELSQARSKTYKDRITQRDTPRRAAGQVVSDVINPMTFPRLVEAPATTAISAKRNKELKDSDWIELHDLLALQKWMPYSRALINSAAARFEDATHAFLLSEQEQVVVNEERSCFVIGRSGTGKTSCALFRLIGIEETCRKQSMPLRQVFVTKSPVLASKIKDYYFKLRQTLDVADLSPKEIREANKKAQDGEIVLQDQEDSIDSLPAKWSDLQDKHFPLFLSFEHLCALLEADLKIARLQGHALQEERKRARQAMQVRICSREDQDSNIDDMAIDSTDAFTLSTRAVDRSAWIHQVDAQTFQDVYWPHFDENLTKGLNSVLCYAEFVGVIQGSEGALSTERGYLSREAYIALSHRIQATFAHARERIYDLFIAYRKMKASRNDWDAADRSFAILKALNSRPALPKIHRLYVDESQDNLLIDAKLLRTLVSDSHGHFWAGDTAQTISASTFRFEDLSAAFYRAEQCEPLVLAGARQAYQPKIYNLLVNYRSHRGITNVAASLVDAIVEFFPSAIDALGRETGIVDGTLPVIFEGFENEGDLKIESFLFGAGDTTLEFGAEQCIIVRDERARTELRSKLGDGFGLILTIYESKGLEFSDVLLYRFFTDSDATESQWRVLYNMMDDKAEQAPKFDPVRHAVLLSELRHLYVAVTRARNRLWIFDTSERVTPLKKLLANQGLIKLCRPQDDLPEMAVSSTPSQWRKTARSLFERKLWLQAANCFARAGQQHWRDVALASMQEDSARSSLKAQKPAKVYQKEFLQAATMLQAVAKDANPLNSQTLHKRAAAAYMMANRPLQAAACHEAAQEWTKACHIYRKADHFDEALRLLRAHPPQQLAWLAVSEVTAVSGGHIDPKEADLTLQTTRIHLVKSNELKKTGDLFEDTDEQLEWLEDYGFNTSGLEILESLGQYLRCAEIRLKQGLLEEAAKSFVTAGFPDRAHDCLYRQLLCIAPIGTDLTGEKCDRQVNNHIKKLLDKLDQINLEPDSLQQTQKLVAAAYRHALDTIASKKPIQLDELMTSALSAAEQMLILDLQLQRRLAAQDVSHEEWQAYIQQANQYCQFMQPICLRKGWPAKFEDVCGLRRPLSDDDGLNGHQEHSQDSFVVPLSCPFYSQLPSTAVPTDGGALMRLVELGLPSSGFFSMRLFTLLQDIYASINKARYIWPPCASYIMTERCPERDDCGRDHIVSGHLQHLKDRIIFWSCLLPLCKQLHWLAGRLHHRKYEFDECRRFRRMVLDAFVQIVAPSTHAAGALQDILEENEIRQLIPFDLLYGEASDGFTNLHFRISESIFTTRLLEYSTVAAFCNPSRFANDFLFTTAVRRTGPYLKLHDMQEQTFGSAIYVFLRDSHLHSAVNVDPINRALGLLESVVDYNLPIHLNAFFRVVETLTIICVLGLRQANGKSNGFSYLTLPESLARQAVLAFSKTRFQMFNIVVQRFGRILSRVSVLILTGDRRFYMDGTPLRGTARNFTAARLLQLQALIGLNDTSPLYFKTRSSILENFVLVRKQVHTHLSSLSRLPPKLADDVGRYVDAVSWEDIVKTLGHFGRGKTSCDRLVLLCLDGGQRQRMPSWLHPIQAISLESLRARFSGQAAAASERKTTTNAWQVRSEVVQTDGLMPFQILTKGKKPQYACSHTPAEASSIESGADAAATSLAEVDPRNVPLPAEDEDQGSWEDVELPKNLLANHADGTEDIASEGAIADIDYAPTTEVDIKSSISEEKIKAATALYRIWRRLRVRRNDISAASTPLVTTQQDLIVIARGLAPSSPAYRYALVSYIPHYLVGLGCIINETKKVKEKLSKKFRSEKIDPEYYHERITSINRCRKSLLDLRKRTDRVLPSNDLDLLRKTIEEVLEVAKQASDAVGAAGNVIVWKEIQSHFEAGSDLFGEISKPTQKKVKRPALNDDLDDVYAIDG